MNRIFAIGDIHGNWKDIRDFNTSLIQKLDETDTIILLGDAGLNFFFNIRDWKTKHNLCKYPCTYFLVRGNHEERPSICIAQNPDKWHTETYFGNTVYVENEFPNIKYALDGVAYYDINGYKTLVIPGAYSVDKYRRLQMGWSWFNTEQLTQDEMERGLSLIEGNGWFADIVLSHTCPITYEPTDLFLSVVDQSMVEKDMERYMGQIEFKLNYGLWLWGHYHQYRVYPANGNKQCVMLFNDAALEINDTMKNLEKIGYVGKKYEF